MVVSTGEQISSLKNQSWVYLGVPDDILNQKVKVNELFINEQIENLSLNNEINGYYKSFEVFDYDSGNKGCKFVGNTLVGLFRFSLGIATFGMSESIIMRICMNHTFQNLKNAVGEINENSSIRELNVNIKEIHNSAEKVVDVMIKIMRYLKGFTVFCLYVLLEPIEITLLYLSCKLSGIRNVKFLMTFGPEEFKEQKEGFINHISISGSRFKGLNKNIVGKHLTSSFGIQDRSVQSLTGSKVY